MRQQGHLGNDTEAAQFLRRHAGDFGNFIGAGLDVDMGIDQRHLPTGQHQHVHRRIHLGAGTTTDDLVDVVQVDVGIAPGAAEHAVGLALVQHHGADEGQAPTHFDLGHRRGHALAARKLVVGLPEIAVARIEIGVDHVVVALLFQPQTETLDALGNDRRTPHQNGPGQMLVNHHAHGAQHALVLALGIDDALFRRLLGDAEHRPHQRAGLIDELLQAVAIGVQIGDGAARHAAFRRRLGHCRGDLDHQARIEGFGNQVVGTETQRLTHVSGRHHVALFSLRQLGDGTHRGHFHLGGDGGGATVERTAENVGEAQHVVDLVRIVRPARGDDGIRPRRARLFRQDFGRGVGQRQDDGLVRHPQGVFGLEHAACGQAEKHVRAVDDFGQGARRGILREAAFVLVHQLGAARVHHAGQIADPDVFARQPQIDQQAQAGQRRSARAGAHQLDLGDVLAHHLQAIENGRADDDGRAVLIVVEHRNVHAGAQLALNLETLRRLDVFEVDAAERGLQRGDDFDQLSRVFFVHLDVEYVDARELLEQHRLAFHHWLGRQRADVAQPQHRGAVGDHRNQVATPGVAKRIIGLGLDFFAGRRHTRRIGQRQIALIGQLLGGDDGEFAGAGKFVIFERGLAQLGLGVFWAGHEVSSSRGRRERFASCRRTGSRHCRSLPAHRYANMACIPPLIA